MGDVIQRKGAGSRDPLGVDSTDVINFTATTTSKVSAMPIGWAGEFVRIQPVGTDLYYYFVVTPPPATGAVTAPPNSVTAPPAATDAGAQSATQGELIKSGVVLDVLVPSCNPGGAVWFCRLGVTAAQSVQITKATGRPGWNTLL